MRRLSAAEIEEYVASGEADDKAGAYGIQGAASQFVTRVEGPRDTVIGLPVERVLDLLAELGYRRKALVP
jgi:septum formation protein